MSHDRAGCDGPLTTLSNHSESKVSKGPHFSRNHSIYEKTNFKKQYYLRCTNKSKIARAERKVKVHFQTLLRRSRFSKQSFIEHLQILKHFQVCKCKCRENKKGMVQITLHRKLQSKFRVIHSKLHDSECLQKPFCYHFLT